MRCGHGAPAAGAALQRQPNLELRDGETEHEQSGDYAAAPVTSIDLDGPLTRCAAAAAQPPRTQRAPQRSRARARWQHQRGAKTAPERMQIETTLAISTKMN